MIEVNKPIMETLINDIITDFGMNMENVETLTIGKGIMMMEIPQKIDKEKFKEFMAMLNSKRVPNAKLIMQKLKMNDDMYDLYFRHYYYKKEQRKNKKVVTKVVVKIKRQNIPDGYSPWINKILNVC